MPIAGAAELTALARKTPLRQVGRKAGRCQVCEGEFVRTRVGEKVCSVSCGIEWAKRQQIARDVAPYLPRRGGLTKAVRAHRENDRKTINAAAQREFNRWIRLVRDDGMPCQSCGKPLPPGPSHDKECGHWKSRGAHPQLRFDESNVALECHRCNHHSDDHLIGLKESLRRRFGQAEIDRLESSGKTRKFTLDELRAIRDEYRRRNREATRAMT